MKNNPWILGEVLFDCFDSGQRVLGGAPFNVAWHLAAFGETPLFLSAVGQDDLGDEVLERMAKAGLEDRGVLRLQGHPTGRVEVSDAETNPTYNFPADSAWDHFTLDASLSDEVPDFLYQGSLFIRNEKSRLAAFKLAQSKATKRFVDVNLRDPWFRPEHVLALVKGVECLKVSLDEFDQLNEWFDFKATGNLHSRVAAFIERSGVENLFITLGSAGAQWFCRTGACYEAPAYPVKDFADSVGAGDASAAIALLGMLRGWPVEDCLDRAMYFASKICSVQGAIPETREVYKHVSEKWDIIR